MVSTRELNVFQEINKIKRENSAHVKPRREMSQIVPDCSGRSGFVVQFHPRGIMTVLRFQYEKQASRQCAVGAV